MTDILWCCHVRGPDDVYAAPDYDTALKWADITNAFNWRGRKGTVAPPASYDDCLLKAAPAIWPWSAEAHAENLPKSIADFAPRGVGIAVGESNTIQHGEGSASTATRLPDAPDGTPRIALNRQ